MIWCKIWKQAYFYIANEWTSPLPLVWEPVEPCFQPASVRIRVIGQNIASAKSYRVARMQVLPLSVSGHVPISTPGVSAFSRFIVCYCGEIYSWGFATRSRCQAVASGVAILDRRSPVGVAGLTASPSSSLSPSPFQVPSVPWLMVPTVPLGWGGRPSSFSAGMVRSRRTLNGSERRGANTVPAVVSRRRSFRASRPADSSTAR